MTNLETEMVLDNDHPYIISPSPVLWMSEMEVSNEDRSPISVWRELSIRSRQRGSHLLKGLEWPGYVVLPSAVIEKILKLNRLVVPERWRSMGSEKLARFIGVLHAWQLERQIFEFSDFAKEIALNGQMDAEMRAGLFSILPSAAIYLNFTNLDHGSLNLPGGAFVGLDFAVGKNKTQQPELIIGIDRFDQVEMFNLPLDGRKVDDVVREAVAKYRLENQNAAKYSESVKYLEHHLLTIISSALMTSSNYGVMDIVPDIGEDLHAHGLWSRWCINRVYNESLNEAYDAAVRSDKSQNLIVVSEWKNSSKNEMASLNCRICSPSDMASIPGLNFPPVPKKTTKDFFMETIMPKTVWRNSPEK